MTSILRLLPLLLVLGSLAVSGPSIASDPPADTATETDASAERDDSATTEEAASEDDAPYDKTIRWATASEVDNFGYDVYRGESADGPFTRLNAEPIAGAGTTDEPSYYTYVDQGLDPGKDYYYYVESISMHGQREIFTPIQKVAAKRPADSATDSENAETDPETDSKTDSKTVEDSEESEH